MARYHDIETSFWEDFQDFGVKEKLLYLYAISNPSVRDSGLYRISLKTILLNTGFTRRDFEGALKGLHGKLHYDFDNKVMFVSGKLKRRLKGLKNNINIIKAIQHDLDEFSASFVTGLFIKKYEGALKGLASLSLPLPLPLPLSDKEKVINHTNINKEKKIEKNKYADTVFMTSKEYSKLINTYGHSQTAKMVKKLDLHKGSKGVTYKSDYKAILNWVVDALGCKAVITEAYKVQQEEKKRENRPQESIVKSFLQKGSIAS